MAIFTCLGCGVATAVPSTARGFKRATPCALYQCPTLNSTNMPSSAVAENQTTLD